MRLKWHRRTNRASRRASQLRDRAEVSVRMRMWMGVAVVAACVFGAAAQDGSFTPMPLDSGFGRMDLTAPTLPADQIIKEFAAKETEFQDALNHYTYRRVAQVQTLDDDNKVDGEWYEVDDVIFDPDGRRT